jgi:peptidoglycan/LPS O-acetylase OafA/YrhL
MQDTTPRASAIDTLTSLRIFAAGYVLLFHSGSAFVESHVKLPLLITTLFSNGYLGVSFFFLLSGFILAYVYHDGLFDRRTIIQYGAARLGRIFPVYLLTLVIEALLLGIHGFSDIPQFFLLQCWGPEKSRIFSNFNGPAWTLSVELAFYFALPLVLLAFSKTKNFLFAIVPLCILMVALQLPGTPTSFGYPLPKLDAVVPITILRLPEFVLGVCLGLQFLRGRPLTKRAANLLALASMAVIAVGLCASTSSLSGSVAAVGFAGLIFAMATADKYQSAGSLLRSPIMVFLGRASFSLYILQQPVHELLVLAMPTKLIAQLLYYPTLLIVSCLIYVFFEENARKFIRGLVSLPPEIVAPHSLDRREAFGLAEPPEV